MTYRSSLRRITFGSVFGRGNHFKNRSSEYKGCPLNSLLPIPGVVVLRRSCICLKDHLQQKLLITDFLDFFSVLLFHCSAF